MFEWLVVIDWLFMYQLFENVHFLSQIEDLDKFRNDSGLTLHWRQYILDDFVTSDITDDYLDKIRDDMKVVREAKFSVVLRFMYTNHWEEVIIATDLFMYSLITLELFLKHTPSYTHTHAHTPTHRHTCTYMCTCMHMYEYTLMQF